MELIKNIFIYAINFGLYIVLFTFMLRMMFQLVKIPASNQFARMIGNLTDVVILPLREYLPKTPYVDLSTLVCWLVVDIIKYTVLVYFTATGSDNFLSIIEYIQIVPADFVMQAMSILFYSTLFYTIISFVAPGLQSVGMDTLRGLCEPALNRARKIISPASGFDFAPMIVLFISKCVQLSIIQFIPAAYFY